MVVSSKLMVESVGQVPPLLSHVNGEGVVGVPLAFRAGAVVPVGFGPLVPASQ